MPITSSGRRSATFPPGSDLIQRRTCSGPAIGASAPVHPFGGGHFWPGGSGSGEYPAARYAHAALAYSLVVKPPAPAPPVVDLLDGSRHAHHPWGCRPGG